MDVDARDGPGYDAQSHFHLWWRVPRGALGVSPTNNLLPRPRSYTLAPDIPFTLAGLCGLIGT